MKLHNKTILILFLSICPIITTSILAQKYPKYGTKEWYSLSGKDRLKSLDIPDTIIHVMKTPELIQSYLDYPLNGLVLGYDDKFQGFNMFKEQFNGLRELIERKDLGKCVIDYYVNNIKPDSFDDSWSNYDKGKLVIKISFFELLIAQDDIINSLNNHDTKVLLNELLKKMEIKEKYYSLYNDFGLSHTSLPITKLLLLKGRDGGFSDRVLSIDSIKNFLKGGYLPKTKMEDLKKIASDFLNTL